MNQNNKLIFVYNADSSLFNQVGDLIHKTILPKTYQCNLCGLTYSGVRMRNDWKEFIDFLPLKVEFLHKDEFLRKYPDKQNVIFPAAFVEENGVLKDLISNSEINRQEDLTGLKALVSEKIKI